jgi:hypothetical protein
MNPAAFRKRKFTLVPLSIALVAFGIGSSGAQSPAQPLNFSTRMRVLTGENVGIGGFIITGTTAKHVVLRALGPSLEQLGVSGPLADPILELYDSNNMLVAQNDNWKDDPAQKALLEADNLAPSNDRESAVDEVLEPGAYTVIVRGKSDTSGVGLIEVYDLNPGSGSKLANISTRAFVDTGNNIVIAGFILGNDSGDDTIAVRGIGPSLTAFGVANPLFDPNLEIRNSNGTLLIENDDWQDRADQAAQLRQVGLQPSHQYESGIVALLQPGSYTALLTGLKNGTGVGLVEVYDLGASPPSVPVNATVTRVETGTSSTIEKQHVRFDPFQFSGTFRIRVYKPTAINHSDIGTRAALQGQTEPISFNASAAQIVAAIEAIPKAYYAYGQFGDLELDRGSFSYFASQGAINREPVVKLDPGGTAGAGFTIEFGSLVGDPPRYNTWVAGMPLITTSGP